ncbi:mannose-1-phosphate guanylyltransferase [Pelotomaculum propionicicum]|uniref:mannose-1-phosphate guanylyltransferase n=1 Tax=Pelotomaculum propionicicum TaxID=258475 RepID=A0A4Y7RUE6_9FIRM|nr:mannose-1-phosphate guanylyltransferase [Pelotomaculum propionicicum]NLI14138.1 mannose-1-phosphate guanylyltransferase [Peptococcaceae bacterium]TEB12359.1 Alginate biosynthesis protein AlgA [Pelotomaculum propionicicum]
MPYAVIMAGGRGERFWPRSRVKNPKQFLKLIGEKTMLQLTVERVEGLVGIDNTYIVTGSEFTGIICEQIPLLPRENIIIEPFGRDTAAAIGLAALHLGRKNPGEVMMVLPADHYIGNTPRFQDILKSAAAAAVKSDAIVTLGITPHSPETGYGYIHRGDLFDTFYGNQACRVISFLEKPDYDTAVKFLSGGNYLWNSGMFVWRISLIRKMIEKYIPQLDSGLKKLEAGLETGRYQEILAEAYSELPLISVDYGILERADNVLVMTGDFGWDDVGTWTALERHADKDENGNVLQGQGVLLDSSDVYVLSLDKPVALIGVENLIVVNEADSLLICHKSRVQEIKKVVGALRDKGFDNVL